MFALNLIRKQFLKKCYGEDFDSDGFFTDRMEQFKELVSKQKMTIIMTTHDPSMMDIADKVYTLEDGEIVGE